MKAYDFEYDGLRLSDLGYTICSFSSSGLETVDVGSQITFNTVSVQSGAKNLLVDTSYKSCLETTFQICRDQCDNDEFEIPVHELRKLNNWLNRKQYLKFRLMDEEYAGIYFEGSFNVSKLELSGITVGLELTFTTNRPYGIMDPKIITLKGTEENWDGYFYDISDEIGYIYPKTEITMTEGGDLEIYSELEDRTSIIKNCTAGEVIRMDNPIISTSDDSHASTIQNDFNWKFPRIANKFLDKKNHLQFSIPCEIKMIYSPVAKIGF